MSELPDDLLQAARDDAGEILVAPFEVGAHAGNELLFLFKPETFLFSRGEQTTALVRMVLECFARFDVRVSGAKVFSGERLAELGTMDRHYGFMNRLSRQASTMSEVAFDGALPVLGGHEALRRYPQFDPRSLTALWATKDAVRLRGGFYVQVHDLGEGPVLLVNGFHPAQIAHFTAAGRKTAVLLLHSDAPWRALRWEMLGDGFPERAAEGSIRREVLRRKTDFSLREVTIANNFAHLSAGPFEALFEIHNFLGHAVDPLQSNVARAMMAAGLSAADVMQAIADPALFSPTEDMDTDEAVRHYRSSSASSS